jgi:OOP family OmpA-OmpF porin
MRTRRLIGSSALALALLTTGLAGPAAAVTRPMPPARIVGVTARVVGVTPRIVSVAPAKTGPGQYTVASDVLFAVGSAQLGGGSHSVLDSVLGHLRDGRAGTVRVTGYTDSVGTKSDNLRLSTHRARAVQIYLARRLTRSNLRFRVAGKGEADPVARNTRPGGGDNPAGRARNRRVVITFVPR